MMTETIPCPNGHDIRVEYEVAPAEPHVGIRHAYIVVGDINPCSVCGGILSREEAADDIADILTYEATR